MPKYDIGMMYFLDPERTHDAVTEAKRISKLYELVYDDLIATFGTCKLVKSACTSESTRFITDVKVMH